MKYLGVAILLLAFIACQQEAELNNKMETIKYIDRTSGEIKTENVPGEGFLKWLYTSATGKVALHVLIKRKIVSVIGGWYMNTSYSKKRIDKFIRQHQIDTREFEIEKPSEFKSFNDFFYRKLKPNARKIGNNLVSPADGKILVFPALNDVRSFFIKGSEFRLEDFLGDKTLADKYQNGAMAIIRLAPPDYHRYHFPATGIASKSVKIKGHYYSVSPLALQKSLRIFCENKREYCKLSSKEYGELLLVDVGATMVGSIIQTYQSGTKVKKGDEKGYFAFGGSTLVLLFEEGKILFDSDLIENTKKGFETTVKMGENIGASGRGDHKSPKI